MVLLIVDAQTLLLQGPLYEKERFIDHVRRLAAAARAGGVEVIYVRHDDGAGQALTKGSPGYEVAQEFAPALGERIFDKTCNSPFRGTGLLEYLTGKGERELMVAGLQTDYCIDATVKCGFEHGFHIAVPAGANTTVDNAFLNAEKSYRYYNEFLWKGRYADCLPLAEALRRLQR